MTLFLRHPYSNFSTTSSSRLCKTITYTYHFNTPGEYAVISKEITGSGVLSDPNSVDFFVDFGDLYYPAVGCESVCSGID